MDSLEGSSQEFRRARTKSLIQIGSLVDKAGLLDTFEISIGADLQRDPNVKFQIAALYKGFLMLNKMAMDPDTFLPLWSRQGLQALKEANRTKNLDGTCES